MTDAEGLRRVLESQGIDNPEAHSLRRQEENQ